MSHPEVFLKYNALFAELVTGRREFTDSSCVYGFCQSSRELFRAAKAAGKYCVLEQMIAPVSEFLAEMRRQHAVWPGLAATEVDEWDEHKWNLRDAEEWQLADVILAPSEYVKICLLRAGVQPAKIRVVPYGVSLPAGEANKPKRVPTDRPLRLLFAGAVDLRKGAPYLIEAARRFSATEIEVRLAGVVRLKTAQLTLPANVSLLGQMDRASMSALYEWADLFVLPSVCEGSATVTYEALVRGVPLIVTQNAGAPITAGVTGILMENLSIDSLSAAIRYFVAEPRHIAAMSESALAQRASLSWDSYGDRLADVLSRPDSSHFSG